MLPNTAGLEYPQTVSSKSPVESKVGLKTVTLSVSFRVMECWEPAAVQTKAHFPLVMMLIVGAIARAS